MPSPFQQGLQLKAWIDLLLLDGSREVPNQWNSHDQELNKNVYPYICIADKSKITGYGVENVINKKFFQNLSGRCITIDGEY